MLFSQAQHTISCLITVLRTNCYYSRQYSHRLVSQFLGYANSANYGMGSFSIYELLLLVN